MFKTTLYSTKSYLSKLLLAWVCCMLCMNISVAQKPISFSKPKHYTRILFVLDCSQSMLNSWDRSTRMTEAKRILGNIADSLAVINNVETGLRTYGSLYEQAQNNCYDTKLEVAFAKNNLKYIKKKLETIVPKGITPISLSLQKCANDFPKTNDTRNVVILITDGIESCNGDPCAISRDLQARGIIIKPFIVGLGVGKDISSGLDCIGQFQNAENAVEFEQIVATIIENVLTQTTAQVNLLDTDNQATETDVNMTFYDSDNMIVKYEMYHTLNGRGLPDTLYLDPIGKYNIDVHTIPRLEKSNIVIEKDKHNTIVFNAPQGQLKISTPIKSNVKCLIKASNANATLNVQDINSTSKYITGKYQLDILTLPRIHFDNVNIDQSKTTVIQVAPAGTLSISRNGDGFGGVFYLKDNVWIKLYSLKLKVFQEAIQLQPGNYRIIYRDKQNKKMKQTITKDIIIKSGQTVSITL